MSGIIGSKEKGQKEQKNSLISRDEQSKNNENEKSMKIKKEKEKKEKIEKISSLSIQKEIFTKRGKFYNYIKKEKSEEDEYKMNNHSIKENYQEKENKIYYKRKISKLNKNEIYENELNDYSKEEKTEKINDKLKLNEKKIYINKCKLCKNCFINNKLENDNLSNNLKSRRKDIRYNIKLNSIQIIFFYYFILNAILFSHFIKSNNRKIKLSYSFISLRIKDTGDINILSNSYLGDDPDIIIINNKNNYTNREIKRNYVFDNSENNITLIWDIPPSSTNNMFKSCNKIIEIDLSNFDSSLVTDMGNMFYSCSSLAYLNLSNFNTSKVTKMNSMFSGCINLISLD